MFTPAKATPAAKALAILFLFAGLVFRPVQTAGELLPVFGGKYDTLAPQQKQLVSSWFAEYQKITGNQVYRKGGNEN